MSSLEDIPEDVMNKNIIFSLIILIGVVIFGVYLYSNNKKTSQGGNGVVLENQQNKESNLEKKEGYSGGLIAGNTSPFLTFTKKDYEKALSEGKIVFLDFYANWCPICRAEAPAIEQGFDSLSSDKVVGFRVNFNDSDTDADEVSLAKELGVPYQHTKIVIKDGKVVLNSGDQWDLAAFTNALNDVLN